MSTLDFKHDRAKHQAGNSQHQPGVRRTAAAVFQSAGWQQFKHPGDDYRRREATARTRCSVLHAYARIQASGTCPTARLIAQLTGICLRHVERVISRAVHLGYLTRGKFVYRSNRLQHVVRELNLSALQSVGTTAGNRSERSSLRATTLNKTSEAEDTPVEKTAPLVAAAATAAPTDPTFKVQKPFRTPRQVYEVARRLIGWEYAAWIYYRALKSGREARRTFAQSVPRSTAYYVKAYRNFCIQYGPQQHQAILENSVDRMMAEQKIWGKRDWDCFYALDMIPRSWQGKRELPSQEVQEKKRAKRTKNPCGQDHNYYSPCAACDRGGAA
jgi:hypothetical protein